MTHWSKMVFFYKLSADTYFSHDLFPKIIKFFKNLKKTGNFIIEIYFHVKYNLSGCQNIWFFVFSTLLVWQWLFLTKKTGEFRSSKFAMVLWTRRWQEVDTAWVGCMCRVMLQNTVSFLRKMKEAQQHYVLFKLSS